MQLLQRLQFIGLIIYLTGKLFFCRKERKKKLFSAVSKNKYDLFIFHTKDQIKVSMPYNVRQKQNLTYPIRALNK
jgi:hypothetical protein